MLVTYGPTLPEDKKNNELACSLTFFYFFIFFLLGRHFAAPCKVIRNDSDPSNPRARAYDQRRGLLASDHGGRSHRPQLF